MHLLTSERKMHGNYKFDLFSLLTLLRQSYVAPRCSCFLLLCVALSFFLIFLILLRSRLLSALGSALVFTTLVYVLIRQFAITPYRPDDPNFQAFSKHLRVGGHRGVKDEAPESTLTGIRHAKASGSNWVDMDIRFTKDMVPVIFNYESVHPTTGAQGDVSSYLLKDIKKLNAAAMHGNFEFWNTSMSEEIPTMEEALQLCQKIGMILTIEIKDPYFENMIPILVDIVSKHNAYASIAFVSFDSLLLYRLKKFDTRLITGHSWRPWLHCCVDSDCHKPRKLNFIWQILALISDIVWDWFLHNLLFKFTGANLLWAEHRHISQVYVDFWKKEFNVKLIAFNVDDQNEQNYFLRTLQLPFITNRLRNLRLNE